VDLTLLPQLLITGLAAGAPLAVLGLGISFILNVANRFHFAYAVTITLGGFVSAVLTQNLGVPPVLSLLAAAVVTGLFGVATEVFIYRPLAKRPGNAALLSIFISALGLTLALEAAIQVLFARQASAIGFPLVQDNPIPLGLGLRTSTLDVISVVVFGGLSAIAVIVLRYTRIGQIVRGVRGNPMMARAVGIRPDTVYVWIFLVASAAAGLVGGFTAARYAATPGMGYNLLFSSFVVAFLAGTRAPALRIVIVGLGLGVVQVVSTLFIPPNLTNLVVFGILFVYLVLKGLGFFRMFGTARRA
jgi:branched-chain amino acid transport system permease protein